MRRGSEEVGVAINRHPSSQTLPVFSLKMYWHGWWKKVKWLLNKHFNLSWAWSVTSSYLQWTTIGPLKKFLKALTRRLSFRRRCGSPGTPWSGQLMNCMWVTSLSEFFSLFCRCVYWDKCACWATLLHRYDYRHLTLLQFCLFNMWRRLTFVRLRRRMV